MTVALASKYSSMDPNVYKPHLIRNLPGNHVLLMRWLLSFPLHPKWFTTYFISAHSVNYPKGFFWKLLASHKSALCLRSCVHVACYADRVACLPRLLCQVACKTWEHGLLWRVASFAVLHKESKTYKKILKLYRPKHRCGLGIKCMQRDIILGSFIFKKQVQKIDKI